MRCEARTHHGAWLCRQRVVPGKARCYIHGGRSTGIKTSEGRARQIAGARAWALKRRADNPGKATF
jgi:hypothetical protein